MYLTSRDNYRLKGLERELNKLAAQGWRVVTAPHMNTVILERAKG